MIVPVLTAAAVWQELSCYRRPRPLCPLSRRRVLIAANYRPLLSQELLC